MGCTGHFGFGFGVALGVMHVMVRQLGPNSAQYAFWPEFGMPECRASWSGPKNVAPNVTGVQYELQRTTFSRNLSAKAG